MQIISILLDVFLIRVRS